MNDRQSLLLRTINSALELTPNNDKLLADQVNGLAEQLGFAPEQTLQMVEELREAGLVELHWPGNISITSQGRSALSPPRTGADHIELAPYAIYIGANAQIGRDAAIGPNAMAASAVRIEGGQPSEIARVMADLVAARQHLISGQTTLPADAQKITQQLAEEANGIQTAIGEPALNKQSVEERLDRAKIILEKLGGLTAAASTLKPALTVLHRSFDWLNGYLQSW
jgi:hypothetical protein